MASPLELSIILSALDRVSGPAQEISKKLKAATRASSATKSELAELGKQQDSIREFRELRDGLSKTGGELDAAKKRARDLQQQLVSTRTPSKALRDEFNSARRTVRDLTRGHETQTRAVDKLKLKLNGAGISTKNLGQASRRLTSDTDRLNARLKEQLAVQSRLASQSERLNAARQRAERTRGTATTLAAGGAAGFAAGAGTLRGISSLIRPGLEFEREISNVQALTRLEKSSAALAELRNQARRLGASTSFTASDAAAGQAFLAMAGFTPEAIQSAMPAVLNAAAAGGTDLATTADLLSNIGGAFGIDPAQLGEVADVLTLGFTTANTDLAQLGETMKFVGVVAREAGLDLQTTTAMAGLLGNVGIQGSQAGTNLREMLNRVASASGPAADALASIGVEAIDSEGNLRNMVELLADVGDASRDLGSGERLSLFKEIFGQRAGAGIAELINQEGLGTLNKYVEQLGNAAGQAEKVAKTKLDNLDGDLKSLTSAWEDLGIELFDQQNGTLRPLVAAITSAVRSVAAFARENPRLTATIVATTAVLAALVALIGGAALVAGAVLGPFALLRLMLTSMSIQGGILIGVKTLMIGVLSKLGAAFVFFGNIVKVVTAFMIANPIIAIITLIALAALLIIKNWGAISDFAVGVWDSIVLSTTNFMEWFASIPGRFVEMGKGIITGLIKGLISSIPFLSPVLALLGKLLPDSMKKELGINSPSRVFADIGRDSMAGLDEGLGGGEQSPLQRLRNFAGRIADAGREAVFGTAGGGAAGGQLQAAGGTNISISMEINAAPGMNVEELGNLVMEKLQSAKREAQARRRSALFDEE